MVACFRNNAIYGKKVDTVENAKVHISLFDSRGKEIGTGIASAFWLNERTDLKDLVPGGEAGCVVLMIGKDGKYMVPWKHRVFSDGWDGGGHVIKDEAKELKELPATILLSLLDDYDQLVIPPVSVGLESRDGRVYPIIPRIPLG